MRQLTINSNSMLPLLKINDRVVVNNTNSFVIGDILVYKKNKSFVGHRLVKKSELGFFVKGDNDPTVELVSSNKILGKIILINNYKFKNNFIEKIISHCSYVQSKIPFIFNIKNDLLRKAFKFLTNPLLYLAHSSKHCL
ncbi:S26 family signal peptidase [archaeon]|nr:S26 family signal peptidase [archaeon]MBL7057010.1 S26 family signal peptidase [Candidatus Woesearchaeota archaeon]